MTWQGKRIHFSGFDSDRPGELVYRFCPVEDESNDLIYQHCDARPGASGSGVYGRVWDSYPGEVGEEGDWDLLGTPVAGDRRGEPGLQCGCEIHTPQVCSDLLLGAREPARL